MPALGPLSQRNFASRCSPRSSPPTLRTRGGKRNDPEPHPFRRLFPSSGERPPSRAVNAGGRSELFVVVLSFLFEYVKEVLLSVWISSTLPYPQRRVFTAPLAAFRLPFAALPEGAFSVAVFFRSSLSRCRPPLRAASAARPRWGGPEGRAALEAEERIHPLWYSSEMPISRPGLQGKPAVSRWGSPTLWRKWRWGGGQGLAAPPLCHPSHGAGVCHRQCWFSFFLFSFIRLFVCFLFIPPSFFFLSLFLDVFPSPEVSKPRSPPSKTPTALFVIIIIISLI